VINRDFADVKTTMAGMGYSVMGTAVRSGENRAREAAMAAIASPLLEAGAIDGARGILINITGSSGLKLSEVIEASSIIQEAAHEDANIIFGAVLDESLGDEVKFTVIATGFREAMPARRERMMAASALPTAHHEVAPPRIVSRPLVPRFTREPEAEIAQPVTFASQGAQPSIRFASETEVEEALGAVPAPEPKIVAAEQVVAPVAPVAPARAAYPVSSYYETARQQAWHEPTPRVEFAPHVDEHFDEPMPQVVEHRAAGPAEVVSAPVPVVVEHIPEVAPGRTIEVTTEGYAAVEMQGAGHETGHDAPVSKETSPELIPVRASVFDDDFFRRPKDESAAKPGEDAASKPWPDARVPSFAGYAGESSAENDELDIPAFLRRKQ
jgi:cell division protein FtsZ